MEQLITDSITILKEGDNFNTAHGWMCMADYLCPKQRSNIPLKADEVELIGELATMLKRVKLEDDIILYKGLTQEFDPMIAEKSSFNTLSANLYAALHYGSYIIKVIVPKGSNALYISAWQQGRADVVAREGEELAMALLPGKFTLDEEAQGLCRTYLYTQF